MLCPTCSKLLLLHTTKNCIKCQGLVLNNLSVLCDSCSTTEKQCAVCLKKVILSTKQPRDCGCKGK